MKDLITGLCVGATITGLCAYLAFKPTPEDADSLGSTQDASGSLEKRKNSSSYSTSATRQTSGSVGGDSGNGGTGNLTRFKDFQEAESTQTQLQLANDVYKLNAVEIQELLESTEMKGLNYMDQGGIMVMNAAFSRLAQLDPQQAIQALESVGGQMKGYAAQSLFKEWSLNDPAGALSQALTYDEPMLKVSALSGVLAEISKNDPEKAFALAKEHKVRQANYMVLLNWGKKDPKVAFEKSSELGQQGQWIRQSILTAWGEREPAEALAYANGLESTQLKSQALSGIVSGMVMNDLDQAYEMLEEYSKSIKDTDLHTVTYRLGQQDPQRAMEWLDTRNGQHNNNMRSTIMGQWVQSDPDAAMAYYKDLKDNTLKSEMGQSILQNLSHQDPKKALELYASFELNQDTGKWILQQAVSRLALTDPEGALTYVEGMTNKTDRKNALKGLVSGLANDNSQKALQFAEQLNDSVEKNEALGQVYQKIASEDPSSVAAHFLSEGVNKIGDYSISDLVRDYARQDLEGAKDFLGEIKDPLIRDRAVGQLLGQWADKDPLAALEYAYEQPQTEGITGAMYTIGRKIAGKNPEEGLKIAFSKPANQATQKLVSSIYQGWLRNDFDAAVEGLSLLDENPSGRKDQASLYATVGSKYSDQPEKGVQWIETIENDKERNYATSSFVSSWARDEPNKAVDWVNTLDEGKHRDSAVKSLVSTFDNAEPAYALEWASSLSDDQQRSQSLQSTYRSWKKRDQAAAQKWLNSTDLVTEKQRTRWGK